VKNKGRSQHRFAGNPLERRFAEEWERKNAQEGRGVLDYLLADEVNSPRGEVSQRDREVAATVIQWLGSPVGQDFLRDVNERGRGQGGYTVTELLAALVVGGLALLGGSGLVFLVIGLGKWALG
jgi:hypothetical protein